MEDKQKRYKTSVEWCEQFDISYDDKSQEKLGNQSIMTIYTPDGWDKKFYIKSFFEETIGFFEFKERLNLSQLRNITKSGRLLLSSKILQKQ